MPGTPGRFPAGTAAGLFLPGIAVAAACASTSPLPDAGRASSGGELYRQYLTHAAAFGFSVAWTARFQRIGLADPPAGFQVLGGRPGNLTAIAAAAAPAGARPPDGMPHS